MCLDELFEYLNAFFTFSFWVKYHGNIYIGGFAKRAHPAQARYLNVNLARRNRYLQPGGKEIEEGLGEGGEEEKEEKSDSW